MLKRLAFIVACCFFAHGYSQDYADQVPQLKRYAPQEVIDPMYGIHLYDELIFPLGGDSVRYDKKGYNVQGWVEDYYTDGSVLHKGFYIDGQLRVFKNYYPNGKIERSFRVIDTKRCDLVVYYQDGQLKSEVFYFNQGAQKQTDYYPNGTVEYVEENEKEMQYLYKRNEFFENGLPEKVFEIIDKKKKLYVKKEFYPSGKIKEEGGMKFHFDMNDYAKEGDWTYYDESGNIIKKEKYTNGHISD
ncbi:MAG: toxin-antitoxin system YwqK family antitoxin [Bacteroidia bacterium]